MRIILTRGPLGRDDPPELPADTHVFLAWEDFSVGPLDAWGDWDKFCAQRAEYHRQLDKYYGVSQDSFLYAQWIRILPRFDLVELHNSGVDVSDIQPPPDLDEISTQATTVELWCDDTVQGQVIVWGLAAVSEKMGIDRDLISICWISDWRGKKTIKGFWNDMLLDTPERKIKPERPSAKQWEVWAQLWDVVVGKRDLAAVEVNNLDEMSRHAMDVIAGRNAQDADGLSNVHRRLLRSARADWTKMARTVSEAMFDGWNEKDGVGDICLQFELWKMAGASTPLIEIKGEGAMRFCEVRLTPEGRKQQANL